MTLALVFQSAAKLALVGGMLLDGYEVPPIHHAVVLIEGERIVQVGRASEITVPADYEVIDTSGRTMLPGLIDLHADLMILGHGDYSRWFSWLEDEPAISMEQVMAISAKQLLEAGITTAVDLGGPLEPSLAIRDRIANGELAGPRMLVSGLRTNEQMFQRYFRDDHVIAQHAFVSPSRFESAGQVILGVEPEWPFFHL